MEIPPKMVILFMLERRRELIKVTPYSIKFKKVRSPTPSLEGIKTGISIIKLSTFVYTYVYAFQIGVGILRY